jgi:hypothetical protein
LPLRGIYRLPPRYQTLIPLPTRTSFQMRPTERRQVEQQGGAWLVIRGTEETADAVVAKLREQLPSRHHIEQRRAFGRVTVVELRLDAP